MNLTHLQGSWALVTGASAGIGNEFARQLAQHGMHVVLLARRADLLHAQAADLQQRCRVQTQVIPLDLAVEGAVDALRERLDVLGIQPRLIVHSAALGRWGRFDHTDAATYHLMLALNMRVALDLCHRFADVLAAQAPSAIIHLSSPAAWQPVPYMAAYAASKAFVHSLSLALHEEWRERGIYVQTLVPGPTATEFDRLAGAYASQIGSDRDPPSKVVQASLRAFAYETPLVISASGTRLQRLFAALAPTRLMLAKVGQMFRPPG